MDAIKEIIMETVLGSRLYGTDTPESDTDFGGVFIAKLEYYLGLNRVSEVDLSIKSKHESGKNTKEAVDMKVYELRNFINLAIENNPNIIEYLFSNKLSKTSPIWEEIVMNKADFLDSNKIFKKFKGYAFGQKQKMIIKKDNIDLFRDAYSILDKAECKFLVELEPFKDKFEFRNNKESREFKVGDIFIPRNLSIKKAKSIIGERLGRVGNRQELILKYGFDSKFGSHLIRLLYEGMELLTTKNIVLPLQQAELIRDIKIGKYPVEFVLDLADKLEAQFELAHNQTPQYHANFNKINDMLVSILSKELKL